MRYCAYYVHCALNGRCVSWLPGAQVKCWMLLTVYTLPQLAVSAKILCLLMVVICGAVPSMVRSVRLYSRCSHRYVNIINGTVMAKSSMSDQPDFTISSQSFDLKLLIHSPRENMYLCFNKRWKLVGRRISREEAVNTKQCLFWESMHSGYNTYASVANVSRYMGFNRGGSQLRRTPLEVPNRAACFTFMKTDRSFDIPAHNYRLGGVGEPVAVVRERRPPRRRHRLAANNELRPRCPDNLRHSHSRHLRRKNCDDGT